MNINVFFRSLLFPLGGRVEAVVLIQAWTLSHVAPQYKTSGAFFFHLMTIAFNSKTLKEPSEFRKIREALMKFHRDNPSITIDNVYVVEYFQPLICITVKESPLKTDYQEVKSSFWKMCQFDTIVSMIVVESDEWEKENPLKWGWTRVEY